METSLTVASLELGESIGTAQVLELPLRDASDEFLIRLLQEGNEEAFEVLFSRYWRLVLGIAWKALRERMAAEDVVQDVFLTIHMKRDQYDVSRGSVKTWIAQFAQFKALMKRRQLQAQAHQQLDELWQFEAELIGAGSDEKPLERAALVRECLSALNPRQRRTIELIHFEGYTLMETASIMQETVANTRNLYYRGIKSLRARVAQDSDKSATATAGRVPVGTKAPLALGVR
jgi:RNA polymerase sigma-70 factor (ECF subfamily)